MTARQLQQTIIRERLRKAKLVPNYTPKGWWECDVFEVTASGYFVEYEVKVSRSDFFADFGKEMIARRFRWTPPEGVLMEKKHDRLLGDTSPTTPRRFWWVVPSGLIAPKEIPAGTGLIYVSPRAKGYERFGGVEEVIVPAPDRHRHKMDPETVKHALGVCYYRMHALLAKL